MPPAFPRTRRAPATSLTIVLTLSFGLVAACSGGGSTSTESQPTAAQASAPTPAAPAPAPPAAAVSPSPAAASPAALQSPSPPPSPAVAGVAATSSTAGVHLTIDPSASHASYHAHEQLVGQSLPNNPVGTTQDVQGTVVLGPNDQPVPDQSKIVVGLKTLKSDDSRRDNFIQRSTLQTNQFPSAEFVPSQLQGLPSPLPSSGQVSFQMLGDMTVHGVTKPVTWDVTAQFDDSKVTGTATTSLKISDFGMTPPKAGPVLSIQDQLELELGFSAAESPA